MSSLSVPCRVLLIGPEFEENLSLRYLAGALEQKGIPCEIAGFDSASQTDQVLRCALRFRPHLVGLSLSFQVRAMEFLSLAGRLRTGLPDCHIVAGGHFATICALELLRDFPDIDSVIRGEGENAIGMLAEAILNKQSLAGVPNLVYRDKAGEIIQNPREGQFPDLDRLPWPVRSRRPETHLGIKTARVMGSRGCFHSSCRYCCIAAFHAAKRGRPYAARETATIVEEMAALKKKGFRIFFFHDDNFLMATERASTERLSELQETMRAAGLSDVRLYVKCRPSSVTEGTAAAMKDLGVGHVFLGIENHSESVLKYLGRTEDPVASEAAIGHLKNAGISVNYNLILFTPTCTATDIVRNLEFVEAHLDVPFNFCRLELYAGTPVEKEMVGAGKVTGSYLGWDYCLDDPAMERMARACRQHLARRRLDYRGLANQNITLAYHADIVRAFFPGPIANQLANATRHVTRAINTDTLFHLRELLRVCTDENSSEEDRTTRLNQIGRHILQSDQRLLDALLSLDRRMSVYSRVCRLAKRLRLAEPSDLHGPVFERLLGRVSTER